MKKEAKTQARHLLIITATQFEVEALLNFLKGEWMQIAPSTFKKNDTSLSVAICGIGLVATTFNLSQELVNNTYDAVLQLGIAGAYPNTDLSLGDLVFVIEDRIADLGAMDKDNNWLDLEKMGLEDDSAKIIKTNPPHWIQDKLKDLKIVKGLSVNCISGRPNFVANFTVEANEHYIESMEGAAFHYVCSQKNIPFVQIRSISNWVEARNKDNWQMSLAIQNLNKWAIAQFGNI